MDAVESGPDTRELRSFEIQEGVREVPPARWRREQLRYWVLRWIYERSGDDRGATVTGPEIGAALHLSYEEVCRVILFLDARGYLEYRGAGPRVCIGRRGIRYLEVFERRRRSIRD